jgi:hypothetical protein
VRRRPDHGLGAVEVLVAAALGMVVAVASVGVFTATVRTVRSVGVRTSDTAEARIALNELTRELRVSVRPKGSVTAVVSATPTVLTFYALLDRSGSSVAANSDVAPSQVTFSYASNCLTVTTTPMTFNGTAWSATGTPVARCVLRSAAAPAFAYYSDPVISTGGVDSTPLDASAGLSAANLALLQSVEITLTATDPAQPGVSGTQLKSRVTMSNVLLGAVV